eukprot:5607427-Amphidinium_carterae.1
MSNIINSSQASLATAGCPNPGYRCTRNAQVASDAQTPDTLDDGTAARIHRPLSRLPHRMSYHISHVAFGCCKTAWFSKLDHGVLGTGWHIPGT